MIDANETFDGTWPFRPNFFEGNGFRQHYVDEGDGDPIVCLHGEPTWGYLYREFIPRLKKHGRVIVPDHMGFGKSETPQDREYSTREHCDNIERLLLDLDIQNATLVLQDWGGPIGSSFVLRHPDRIRRLVLMDTAVPWAQAPAGTVGVMQHHWFKWVNSDAFEPTITNLGSTALSVLKRAGFERTAHVDETWIRAYSSPFPTVESCRGALQFPRNIANPATGEFFQEILSTEALERIKHMPAMYIHGEEDRALPVEAAVQGFKSFWPDAPVVTLPGVGHFLQEDAPEAVTAMIEMFIQQNG
jgi:pimeloyl-ACP methyl ester carboxylesterase